MGVLLGLWVEALVDGKVCRWRSRAGGVVVEEVDIQVPDPQLMTMKIVGRNTTHALGRSKRVRFEGMCLLLLLLL